MKRLGTRGCCAVCIAFIFWATFLSGAEVQFAASEWTVLEAASVAQVEATRTDTGVQMDVRVRIIGGTAVVDQDYVITTNLIRFTPGQATAGVGVYLRDDPVPEPHRDVLFELVPETPGVTIGATATCRVLIQDDDAEGFPGLGAAGYDLQGFSPFAPRVNVILQDSRGRILVGGQFSTMNGEPSSMLARLLPDGRVDPSFLPGFRANGQIFACVLLGDERILIGGQFTEVNGTAAGRIARLLPDGDVDPSFSHGPGFQGTVETLELLPDGRILAAGFFLNYEGVARQAVAILHPDGALDDSFNPTDLPLGLLGHGARWIGDSVLFIADSGRGSTNLVVKLDAGGARKPDFVCDIPGDSSTRVTGMVPQADGRLIVAGQFASINGVERGGIARLNGDGSVDETFDPGLGADNWILRVFPASEGRILLVGHFLTIDGVPRPRVALLNSDGSLDPAFNPDDGPSAAVNSALPLVDGTILLGGFFGSYDKLPRFCLAAVRADGSLRVQFPEFIPPQPTQDGLLTLRLLNEPLVPVILFESGVLPGWENVAVESGPRRVLEFQRPLPVTENRFYRAEWQPSE